MRVTSHGENLPNKAILEHESAFRHVRLYLPHMASQRLAYHSGIQLHREHGHPADALSVYEQGFNARFPNRLLTAWLWAEKGSALDEPGRRKEAAKSVRRASFT